MKLLTYGKEVGEVRGKIRIHILGRMVPLVQFHELKEL